MTRMTTDELAEHLQLLTIASRKDLDELLIDLLRWAWPSPAVQNS